MNSMGMGGFFHFQSIRQGSTTESVAQCFSAAKARMAKALHYISETLASDTL